MISFELKHCSDSLVISDFQYSKEDAKSGNPYNTAINITVISGAFSSTGECECDIYGSHVTFDMYKTGHITVSGEIFGHAMIHNMKFKFVADQSSLKPFADALKQSL